jgi:hypothetical protein
MALRRPGSGSVHRGAVFEPTGRPAREKLRSYDAGRRQGGDRVNDGGPTRVRRARADLGEADGKRLIGRAGPVSPQAAGAGIVAVSGRLSSSLRRWPERPNDRLCGRHRPGRTPRRRSRWTAIVRQRHAAYAHRWRSDRADRRKSDPSRADRVRHRHPAPRSCRPWHDV